MMPFKYLDLVKVTSQQIEPGKVHIIAPGAVLDNLQFYTGAIGRVIGRAKTGSGYQVWFPVPNYPERGQLVELAEGVLKLHRGAVEEDYDSAHFPGGKNLTAKAMVEEMLNAPIRK